MDAADKTGQTPLHWVANAGLVPMMVLLLEHGASMDAEDERGYHPLHHAVQHQRSNAVQYLLLRGASVTAQDKEGHTPLHWAVYHGFDDIAQQLLSQGSDPNAVDATGMTPLHWACLMGKTSCARLLLSEGVDVTVKDTKGQTARDKAIQQKFPEILQSFNMPIFSKEHHRKDRNFIIFKTVVTVVALFNFFWGILPDHRDHTLLGFVIVFSALAENGLLFRLVFGTPGPVHPQHPSHYMKHIEAGEPVPLCLSCRIQRPIRSKHCRVCGKCIPRFDHHCPWILNDVGWDNHRMFMGFLLAMNVLYFAYTRAVWIDLATVIKGAPAGFFPAAWYTLVQAPLTCLMIPVLVFAIGFALSMLISQSMQISRNLTTNEMQNLFRYSYFYSSDNVFHNPFDHGLLANWREFLFHTVDYHTLMAPPHRTDGAFTVTALGANV